MKLKVLVDNNTLIDKYFLGEPAVSYYIEDENEKILFDVGYSNVIIKNAKLMNIDIKKINKVVLSHGHNDHTGGLGYLLKENRNVELICHPSTFDYKEYDGLPIGCPMLKEEITNICKLNLSETPVNVSNNIIYLGKIPRSNKFELEQAIGKTVANGNKIPDLMEDDSAIVYKSNNGIFIITGCSHSGICNIIEYAKTVCNDNKVIGVIGGLHLFENNDRLKHTITYLKENNIKYLYPCHCTSLDVKIELAKSFNINEVGVGLEIEV